MDTNEHECCRASAAADHVVFAGVVSAKAAVSVLPWSDAPRIIEIRKPPAVKARFTPERAADGTDWGATSHFSPIRVIGGSPIRVY